MKQKPELRAILRALNFDPDTHRLMQRRLPEGVLVIRGTADPDEGVNVADVCAKFLSKKTFTRICREQAFQDAYERHLAAETWVDAPAVEQSA